MLRKDPLQPAHSSCCGWGTTRSAQPVNQPTGPPPVTARDDGGAGAAADGPAARSGQPRRLQVVVNQLPRQPEPPADRGQGEALSSQL
jgi:hypothetical protein